MARRRHASIAMAWETKRSRLARHVAMGPKALKVAACIGMPGKGASKAPYVDIYYIHVGPFMTAQQLGKHDLVQLGLIHEIHDEHSEHQSIDA